MRPVRVATPGFFIATEFYERIGSVFKGQRLFATGPDGPAAMYVWQTRGKARQSFDIDNLTGLRSGNHIFQIGVLIDGAAGVVALFGFTLDAALLLVLLFLFSSLFSAAFFQRISLGWAHDLTDGVGCVMRADARNLDNCTGACRRGVTRTESPMDTTGDCSRTSAERKGAGCARPNWVLPAVTAAVAAAASTTATTTIAAAAET
jgi:hypothetical protein